MLKITKAMLEAMYVNSDNQDVSNDYVSFANSIRMETEIDGNTLQVSVYSHFLNHSTKNELIQDGETNAEKIYDESSHEGEQYNIDYPESYEIENEAILYLEDLHQTFSNDTKYINIDHIEYDIENYGHTED